MPQEGASTATSAAASPVTGSHPGELPDQSPRGSETAPKRQQQQQRRRRQPASDVVLLVGFAQEEVRLIRDNAGLVFPSPPSPPDATDVNAGTALSGGGHSGGGSGGGMRLPAVMGVGRAASKRLVGSLVDKARALQREWSRGEAMVGSDGALPSSSSSSSSSSTASPLGEVPASSSTSASPLEEDCTVETRGGLAEGRVVLLLGPGAQQHGGALNEVLLGLGIAPAVVGAVLPHHEGMPLEEVVGALRQAHAGCGGVGGGGRVKGAES